MAADTTTPQALESLYPAMSDKITSARAEGYSDSEIEDYIGGKIETARSEGYSDEEISAFLGAAPQPPEPSWKEATVDQAISAGTGMISGLASLAKGSREAYRQGEAELAEHRKQQFVDYYNEKLQKGEITAEEHQRKLTDLNQPKGPRSGLLGKVDHLFEKGNQAGDRIVEDTSDYWSKVAEEYAPKYSGTFLENPSVKRGVSALVQGGVSLAAAIPVSLLMGPEAGAVVLSGAEAGGIYEDAVKAGKNPKEALDFAVKAGAVTYLLEKYGLDSILKASGPAARRFIMGMAGESGTEGLQTIVQNAIAHHGYDESTGYFDNIIESLIGGAIGGPAALVFGERSPTASKNSTTEQTADPDPQGPITDESRLLPAPTVEVSPEGAAVAPEQKSAIINQGLNVQGMTDDQVAASQQNISAPPMPTPDPARVSNLGVIAERGLMVLPQAQSVHAELIEDADPNNVIYAEGGPITDPGRMLVNPFQVPAPAAQVSPEGVAVMPEQKSGMINQQLSGMPDSEIAKAQERLNEPERLDALTAQRDKVAGNILKKDGMPRAGVAPKALARLFALNEQVAALTPTTTPEPAKTLDAQMEALRDGRKPAVLITEGEALPEVPEGFQTANIPEGTLIFSKEGTLNLAKAGKLGSALGYGIDAKPEGSTTVVTARDESGTVIQDVLTDGSEEVVKAAEQAGGVNGTVEVRPVDEAISEREVRYSRRANLRVKAQTMPDGPEKSVLLAKIGSMEQRAPQQVQQTAEATPAVAPVSANPARASKVKEATQQRLDYLRRKFQDKFLPLKRVQQKLKKQGWQEREANNPYLTEELYHGIAKDRLDKFEAEQVESLLQSIKEAGVSLEELENYLYAKHAPERNAYIQKINPDAFEEGGSGMTDEEAAAIIDRFRRAGKLRTLHGLAQQVWELAEMQRDIIHEAGLEEQDRLDAWESFSFYVPLKGTPDGIDEGHGRSVGRGFAVTKSGTKAALGRQSRAENILAHLTAQVADTIVRAERAKVGQAFLQMVEENPDPELWTVRTKDNLPTRQVLAKNPAYAALNAKLQRRQEKLQQAEDGAEIERLQEEIAEIREELAATAPRQVAEVDDFEWMRSDNVLPVTRDGVVHYVQIEDADLAKAMKNLSQPEMGKSLRALAAVNRVLAMVNTSLRPEFVITNFERDFQTAMVNLSGEQSAKMAAKVAKGVPGAMKGIHSVLRGNNDSGMASWYARFKEAGAQVGYLDLQSVEETQKQIQKMIRHQDGKAATAWKFAQKIGKFIGDYNTIVENAVRLSAFKTAIESGASEAKAASLAKNLTVNFNRKGELGPAANALYLFFNAGVQGSARIVTALTNKRVRKICYGITALSFALAEMNRLLAGDDDDDKNRWDKVSDYTKHTNLILMRENGDAWKIKTPYGYNMFVALGYTLSDAVHYLDSGGIDGKSPGQAAVSLFKAGMNAFNPLGGDDALLQTVSPTILDPFVQIETNENFMGNPIMPEQPAFGPPKPDSELYWNSVRPYSKAIAQQINELTGGSDVVPGLVDISPETMDHIYDFVLGGLGRDAIDTFGLAQALITGEELPLRRIPLVRTAYQEKSEFYDRQAFHESLDKAEAHFAKVKQLAEAGRRREAREYVAENPEVKLAKLGRQVRLRLSKLHRLKEGLEKHDKVGSQKRIDAIDEEVNRLMLLFNRQYNRSVY